MLDDRGSVPSAGWFADPLDPSRQRWWDGAGWTDRVITDAVSDAAPTLADASAPVASMGRTFDPIVLAPPDLDRTVPAAPDLDTIVQTSAPIAHISPFAPNQPPPSQPLTRRELRKRVGPLTYGQERWRPSVPDDADDSRPLHAG